MTFVSSESLLINQLASDWMHQGIDLAKESSAATLEKAVRCFDEAIALRRTLPLEENHFLRYGLSAGWINRGDAMARLGGAHFLVEAIKSYDEALILLESLPLEENALYPRRLAITWINRGIALQKREIADERWEAMECFREAIQVLEHPSAMILADRSSLWAGAWINLAGVLMGSGTDDADEVRSAIQKALPWIKSSEQTDLLSAEMGVKARHMLCRLALRDIAEMKSLAKPIIEEATDAVDEALTLHRHWQRQGQAHLESIARDIFCFGCRIYENSQPHFLAEFLMENLITETGGEPLLLDKEAFDAAQAAIWSVLDKLQFDGFQFVSTSYFEPFLSDIQELRKVEERLKQLRLGRAG